MERTISYVSTIGSVIPFLRGFKIPAAISNGTIILWLTSLKTEFQKGSNAKGAVVTALGNPSDPQITDVTTIY